MGEYQATLYHPTALLLAIKSHTLFADAPPTVLEQQLQTFLQSLNITDPRATADDPKYQEFLTGEPQQPVSHIDWASEYQQQAALQHAVPGQNMQHLHHSLPEQQAHEDAWGAARQALRLEPHTQLQPRSDWADAFHQSNNPGPQSWAEDFNRLHRSNPAQPAPAHPSSAWVSEFQSHPQQLQPADRPWAEQFLASDDQQWAEQFATDVQRQQKQAKARQLTPEEQKALRGPHPDDPLDDKAALSWVRQFNEEAANSSVNFGTLFMTHSTAHTVMLPWFCDSCVRSVCAAMPVAMTVQHSFQMPIYPMTFALLLQPS